MPTPSLIDLASQILQSATALQHQLSGNSLPQPSFDPAGRRHYHDVEEHPDILAARAQLIDASQMILSLARGPLESLEALGSLAKTNFMVLTAIDELEIAQAIPVDQPIAIEAVASKLCLHVDPLQRLLRYAYTMQIFHGPHPGFVAHTALSAAIPWYSPRTRLLHSTPVILGGLKLAESMRIREDRDSPAIPILLALPQYKDFWEIVHEDPEGMSNFSAAMQATTKFIMGEKQMQYVQGFDWAVLGENALVVDLGGGNGHAGIAVAKAHKNLRVVIQDLETNTKPARDAIPDDLRERVTFEVQDFFKPQPDRFTRSPPKAYLISRVFHDWKDEDCIKILRNLIPLMQRGGTKLFIVDRVLPDMSGEMPSHREAIARAMDLFMYTLFAAKERTLMEWKELFNAADEGLRIERVDVPLGAGLETLVVGLE